MSTYRFILRGLGGCRKSLLTSPCLYGNEGSDHGLNSRWLGGRAAPFPGCGKPFKPFWCFMHAPSTSCCTKAQQRGEGTRVLPPSKHLPAQYFCVPHHFHPPTQKEGTGSPVTRDPKTQSQSLHCNTARCPRAGKREGQEMPGHGSRSVFFHLRCYSFLGLLLPGLPRQPDSQLVGIL